MAEIKSHTWIWRFDSPVERVWPVLADTARFNEAAGLPKHAIEEIPRPDGSVLYIGRARIGPFRLEWEDQPVNWVAGQWFRHRRRFRTGPLASLTATMRFFAEGEGCRGEYTVEAEAANLLGRVILATGFFPSIGRTFGRLAENARDFAGGRRRTEFEAKPPIIAAAAAERAAELVAGIERTANGHGLARRLADWALTRPEVDVFAIRPLKLARLWGVPERDAAEICLEAARQGLLGLRWDLLCPRCQVGKRTASSLDQLPTGAHCPSCNIDYDREFSKNVEVVFQPAQSIRPLAGGEYCLFGPMSTPHIKLHLTLAPGEARSLALDLPHGNYRLRTLEAGGEQTVQWDQGGFPAVIADGAAVTAGEPAPIGAVTLSNRADRPLTLIVEERAWRRDALTADRAITFQAFRDLFSREVLRPGDSVGIDRVTLMFTDLKGSTALYDRIGDAVAYGLVRQHFAILGRAVRECEGAIVKTIGDAIMAAFARPEDGLRCAIRIHDDIAAFNAASGKEPITIKLGLHTGRCISVTLNDRLDYYGSAANLTARLEGRSRGGDIVISDSLAADPAVRAFLAGFSPVAEEAELKGFAEPVRYWRITAEELVAKRR